VKLAVIARYFSLNEAQVVGSLLRACGFQASVADETFGSVQWTVQPVLNGFRVCVPWDEAADAVAVLHDVAPPPTPLPKPPLHWSFWRCCSPASGSAPPSGDGSAHARSRTHGRPLFSSWASRL
jgi:hypothetical protein